MGILVICLTINTQIATGGITTPIMTVMAMIMLNHMGLYPSLTIAGKKIGVARIMKARSSINDPPMRYMKEIMMTIMVGGNGRDTIQSAASIGILVTAIKWPSIVELMTSGRTMHAVLTDSMIDLTYPLRSRALFSKVRRRTRHVPTLPASVGVKNPVMMPPTIRRKTTTTHPTSGSTCSRALQGKTGPLGPTAGLSLHHP